MDVAVALANKVKWREELGRLPFIDLRLKEWIASISKGEWQLQKEPETKYAPLSGTVGVTASYVLRDYFDGRTSEDQDEYQRILQPYHDHVLAAWYKEGRNRLSIRHLGILADEWLYNMEFYWADVDVSVRFFRYLTAAQHLGIEADWPELLPARPEMRPQAPEPQPQYSPPKQKPYASNPNFAATIFQQQNDANWAMANPGGWAMGGMRVRPDGGILTNPYQS